MKEQQKPSRSSNDCSSSIDAEGGNDTTREEGPRNEPEQRQNDGSSYEGNDRPQRGGNQVYLPSALAASSTLAEDQARVYRTDRLRAEAEPPNDRIDPTNLLQQQANSSSGNESSIGSSLADSASSTAAASGKASSGRSKNNPTNKSLQRSSLFANSSNSDLLSKSTTRYAGEEDTSTDPLLSALIDRVRPVFASSFNNNAVHYPPIDIMRARYLLEASAGNIDLAVSLYMDDYMANASHQQHLQQQALAALAANAAFGYGRGTGELVGIQHHNAGEQQAGLAMSSHRFGEQQNPRTSAQLKEQQNSTDRLDEYDEEQRCRYSRAASARGSSLGERAERAAAAGAAAAESGEAAHGGNFEPPPEAEAAAAALAAVENVVAADPAAVEPGADRNNNCESVSVSDDDAAAEHLSRRQIELDNHRVRSNSAARKKRVLGSQKGQGQEDENEEKSSLGEISSSVKKKRRRHLRRVWEQVEAHRKFRGNEESESEENGEQGSKGVRVSPKNEGAMFNNHDDKGSDFSSSDSHDDDEDDDDSDYRDNDDSVDDYAFLTDEDEELNETADDNRQLPSRLLWGRPVASTSDALPQSGNAQEDIGEGAAMEVGNDNSKEGDRPAPEDDEPITAVTTIPRTWINAGFTLSTCGTGLFLRSPSDEDLAILRSLQSSQRHAGTGQNRLPPLPPHHCGGVTALLSLATALLYTGASIQGNEVNCNSLQKPFLELTPDEKKREYDTRLANVLSSILFIAAQTAAGRRKKALAALEAKAKSRRNRRKKRDEDATDDAVHECSDDSEEEQDLAQHDMEQSRRQLMHRRLRLCPVCRWEEDPVSGELKLPHRVETSYTNVKDLRYYVLSNLRSFTGKGGCALLLETILRIHGTHRVERMVRRCCEKELDGYPHPLLRCKCEERQRLIWEESLKQQGEIQTSTTLLKKKVPVLPQGHDCISTKLLSLVLTGSVHNNLTEWAVPQFGMGVLTTGDERLCHLLKYPPKSVWIIRGDICYSTLWHDDLKPGMSTQERSQVLGQDLNGGSDSFRLTHWNCWYGIRNKTELRVIAARGEWGAKHQRSSSKSPISVTAESVACQDISSNNAVTREEIDCVLVHSGDQTFYPNQYKRWRYNFDLVSDKSDLEDQKMPASINLSDKSADKDKAWIPYFRLNKRQQQIVEQKLAPRINLAIWSRWVGATVDEFKPAGLPLPVV